MGQGQDTTGKGKWKQLSERDRYKIEVLSQRGLTPAEIGKALKRNRRTIERELARGSVEQKRLNPSTKNSVNEPLYFYESLYLADAGQRIHDENATNKGRSLKIGRDHKLAAHIEQRIKEDAYSPDAILGEIQAKGMAFDTMICTKTLYNYIDAGMFANISNKDLPVKRNQKKRDYKRVRKVALNNTKGRSIEERPPETANRETYGHWEMDCVVGKGKACLLVMTERQTREPVIIKLAAKTQTCVVQAVNQLERKHKQKFKDKFKSITMDNGGEFLDMQSLERSCLNPNERRTVCYYAHPYSAYERGSNENMNRLIRRFIPKGANIAKFTKASIKRIEQWIANYPRRMFAYKSTSQLAA
jgi:IS30 family transposase